HRQPAGFFVPCAGRDQDVQPVLVSDSYHWRAADRGPAGCAEPACRRWNRPPRSVRHRRSHARVRETLGRTARLGVCVTEGLTDACVALRSEGDLVAEWRQSISVAEPLIASVPLSAGVTEDSLSVVLE